MTQPAADSDSVLLSILDILQGTEIERRVNDAEFIHLFPRGESVPPEEVRDAPVLDAPPVSGLAPSPEGGDSRNDRVLVRSPTPEEPAAEKVPIIRHFSVSTNHAVGEPSLFISWHVDNADSVLIGPGIGVVSAVGVRIISATQSTRFCLTATNAEGTDTRYATLALIPPATEKEEAKEPPPPQPCYFRSTPASEPSASWAERRTSQRSAVESVPCSSKFPAKRHEVFRVAGTGYPHLIPPPKEGLDMKQGVDMSVACSPKEKKNGS